MTAANFETARLAIETETSEQYVLELYRLVYPDWDDIGSVDGFLGRIAEL